MLRRTKIIATLGPATDPPKVLDRIIEAGVDLVRINFAHDTVEQHLERAERVRNRAQAHGRQVGVLADLQGPQIRIQGFINPEGIELREGDLLTLDTRLAPLAGTEDRVGITYPNLCADVKRGDTLLLDGGRVALWVDGCDNLLVKCRVVVGGHLTAGNSINRQGGGFSAAALTEKDRADIRTAARMEADYVAVSFARSAEDINEARQLLVDAGGNGRIIAKIERAEALAVADEIIRAADAILLSRGDLGVEIGDAALPPVQKRLIQRARVLNRTVITATQMMTSMIQSQIPTRAEVFDVANAVLDGTDAVMLSAETATGNHPDKVIAAMHRICIEAEKQRSATTSDHRIHSEFCYVDEAIAMAAMYTANHLKVKAIAALTESGATALWMSRISSSIPIYAMTRRVETRRRVTLYRGVYPVSFDSTAFTDHAELNREAIDELLRRGAVRDGDLVIITKGDLMGVNGGTNALKVVKVGELL